MAPSRKRVKTSGERPSVLLTDYRTAWVVKSDEPAVEIRAGGEVLSVRRSVLTQHSNYFESCLKSKFKEGIDQAIDFHDDVDPKYLAFFIGVAYSFSSIVPHAPPLPDTNPETSAPKSALKDFVEVYKLCDRFICPLMMEYIVKCIHASIGNNHRALFRSQNDEAQQRCLMRDFADAFEALDRSQKQQDDLAVLMVRYFCAGVNMSYWVLHVNDIKDCGDFVMSVSQNIAQKVIDYVDSGRKIKRKELTGP